MTFAEWFLLAWFFGGYVYRCESDGEIVRKADIQAEAGHRYGRHIIERDERGRAVTLCGYVHRVPRSMPVM
jgi:hypothetical protein